MNYFCRAVSKMPSGHKFGAMPLLNARLPSNSPQTRSLQQLSSFTVCGRGNCTIEARKTTRLHFQRHCQTRHVSFAASSRRLYRENPITFPLSLLSILVGGCFLVYSLFSVYNYDKIFQPYPEKVATKLRRAIYYTYDEHFSPNDALKNYLEALKIADQLGMDPFSNDILGIKLQIAYLMEKVGQYRKAIEVLEVVCDDIERWLKMKGSKAGNEVTRSRLLAKSVSIKVKLSELYSDEYIDDLETAEQKLTSAVETVLKEQRRRSQSDDDKLPDKDAWMSNEEIGAALESLAHVYEKRDRHALAAPLFLQALTLVAPKSCHAVVLMNNLSISLAQQSLPLQPGSTTPAASRAQLVESGKAWAQKAIALAAGIAPPERNEECDVGCAVATHNLGEFAEMNGNIVEAKKRYVEAESIAKGIGFEEGIANAREAIKRLEKTRTQHASE